MGYDTNADDTIDEYIVDESFGSTSVTVTNDNAGNLTYDGTYRYTYDPWNRLVKTTLNAAGDQGGSQQDITIQTAKYDGQGRRVTERARGGSVKVVTNSGDLDGTVRYYYDKNQIIETLDGAGKLINQVYHGTQYIDEIVAMRTEFGRAYVHQDANWNVIGLTDITGRSLERYYYSPYGELEAVRDAHFFDYDDDGDVDNADNTALTACIGQTSGDCLRFDADADGTITQDDAEAFSSYTATLTTNTELQRIPATTSGSLGNPFGHQGLAFDAEIGSYQNRHRQYAPKMKRFMQTDSLAFTDMSLWRLKHVVNGPGIAQIPQTIGFWQKSNRRFNVKLHYEDGLNLHARERINPLRWKDPMGLNCACVNWASKCAVTVCGEDENLMACINPDIASMPKCGNPQCVAEHEQGHMNTDIPYDCSSSSPGEGPAAGRNKCDMVVEEMINLQEEAACQADAGEDAAVGEIEDQLKILGEYWKEKCAGTG